MCPCGRSGRFHVCLLGAAEELASCPVCGGLGRYVAHPELPVWHADYYADCDCPAQQRRDNWSASHAAAVDQLSRINQPTAREQRFDNFDLDWPPSRSQQVNLRQAMHLAMEYAANPQWWSLTLKGVFGCGKTHLGRAMQGWRNDPRNRADAAAFVAVPDLLDAIRATYGPDSDVSYATLFRLVRNAPFLVMDDLGAEYGTEWVDDKLYQIVNHRYVNQLPTVILTNLPLAELSGRILSRLEEGKIFTITAGDYRRRN